MFKQLSFVMTVSLTLVATASAQKSIEQLAPENTILVLGVDNVQSAIESGKRTSLWELWRSDEIQKMTEEAMEEFAVGLMEMYKDLGVEEGSLVPPTGAAGMALYTHVDEETGMPQLALFAFADYGEDADKFGILTEAAIEEAQEKWDTEFDIEDILGREAWVIVQPDIPEDLEGEEFEFDEFGGNPFMPDPEQLMEQIDRMYYLREGNLFFAASEPESLRGALELIDGEDAEMLSSREDFQNARRQLGESDGYALVLFRDFGSVVDAIDESGMFRMMAGPSVQALIGEIDAFGFGYRLDGPTAMLEATYTAYMPNGKGGIFALLDTPTQRGELPAFVGPETVSYNEYNFEFDGVLDFVRDAIKSNAMISMQLAEQMPQIEDTIRRICDPLGQKICVANTLRKPIELESMGSLFAIECTDPEAFEELIAMQGPAIGLEPRDFLGSRIYTLDSSFLAMGGMGGLGSSLSLGLGGGYLFLGTTPAVEQGLRTAGQDGLASLADDEQYARAIDVLTNDPVVTWGYSNLIDTIEASSIIQKLTTVDAIKQMEEFDPEMAADMKADLEAEIDFMSKLDVELLKRYLGPVAYQARSTDDGFVISTYVLSAKDE